MKDLKIGIVRQLDSNILHPSSKQWLISDKPVQLSGKERKLKKNKNKIAKKSRNQNK